MTDFETLAEQHRAELRVHCYRMLGSFDEAEDLVQETLVRAWKGLDSFQGRSSLRAWLYRIATNACLDALEGRARRVLPSDLTPPGDPRLPQAPRSDVAWLQPFPDRLWEADRSWEPVAPAVEEPESALVAKETIELAFLAAIQHLPPRQRAVLILHDVLGWPARETASALDSTVASVNSALQRARATMRAALPARRSDWSPTTPSNEDRAVLQRYMAAVSAGDLASLAELLAEDVRTSMPPFPLWFAGRDSVLAALAAGWDPDSPEYVGSLRLLPTRANGALAAGAYVRAPGASAFEAFAIGVLSIEAGLITEIVAFHEPALFPAFDLPSVLA